MTCLISTSDWTSSRCQATQSEFCAYPGHGTDVVLMSVRDDDGLNSVFPLRQEAGVRQNFLHAQVRETATPVPCLAWNLRFMPYGKTPSLSRDWHCSLRHGVTRRKKGAENQIFDTIEGLVALD